MRHATKARSAVRLAASETIRVLPDKIAAGSLRTDLPVQRSSKFELIIKTPDRQSARSRNSADPIGTRRRGDRLADRECQFIQPPTSKGCTFGSYFRSCCNAHSAAGSGQERLSKHVCARWQLSPKAAIAALRNDRSATAAAAPRNSEGAGHRLTGPPPRNWHRGRHHFHHQRRTDHPTARLTERCPPRGD